MDTITTEKLSDEQQREIFGRLRASRSNTLKVTVTFYDGREYRETTGIVAYMDQRYIKLELDRGWTLVGLADVAGVEFGVV